MGLLSQYIAEQAAKSRDEKNVQLEAYKTILTSPQSKPEAKQYAVEQMMKAAGMKGPGKELFSGLLGALTKKSPKSSDTPSFSGPGVPASMGVTSQQEDIGGLPVNRQRLTMTDPGEPGSKGMFYSPGELDYMARESERKSQEIKDTMKLDLQRREDDLALTFEKNQQIQHDAIADSLAEARLQQTLKDVPNLPLSEEKKQDLIWQAYRLRRGLPQEPRPQAAEFKPHQVVLKDGTSVPARELSDGTLQRFDGQPLNQADIAEIDPKDAKPPAESQEVRDRTAYWKSQGLSDADAHTKALAENEKKLDTRETTAEDRLADLGAKLADALAERNAAKEIEGRVYQPGGASIANPKHDLAIETGAWDYLTTGHVPFTGFSSGGKGKPNPREMMISRAGEVLQDLGLTGADLPAIRGAVKGDTAALSRITTTGAMIQQFEDTLEKNLATAERLDAAFKRGDIRFYNRVLGAFKTGKGDKEALDLAAQLHAIAREWGKIMQGSTSAAGVQISEANAADEFFARGISSHQLESLITDVVEPDVRNRSAAIEGEQDRLRQALRTAAQAIKGSQNQGPAIGTVVNGYKFTGGDPNDKKNWTEVKK